MKKFILRLSAIAVLILVGSLLIPFIKAKQEEICWSSLVEIVNSNTNIDSLVLSYRVHF